MSLPSALDSPAETQRKIVCDRCGLARPGELRRLELTVNRVSLARRDLCPACVDASLDGIGAALRRIKPRETLL